MVGHWASAGIPLGFRRPPDVLGPSRCSGGHRLVVENAAQEIHDELSRDGASGQQATPLEE